MGVRTVGRVGVAPPALVGDRLTEVSSLDGDGGRPLRDFWYDGAEFDEFTLGPTHLVSGRVSGLRAARARIEGLRAESVEFVGCDLSRLTWSGGGLTRVVFRDCDLTGGRFSGLTLRDVLFEDCRLDGAGLANLEAKGPVAFTGCGLAGARFSCCDLDGGVLADCRLDRTEFSFGSYRRLDLRGNDLSRLRGAAHLHRVVVDRVQEAQLARALTAELDVVWGDGLPGAA